MNRTLKLILVVAAILMTGCKNQVSQEQKDRAAVERQQKQYSAHQSVPVYDWSLERHLVIQLYNIRNQKAVTHSVWRSSYGMIEGDCPSMGFGIPYDTSITNPLRVEGRYSTAITTIEQAEPNGIFASKNTTATWVMCVNDIGVIEPIYVESKVTVYPYLAEVDYANNRVVKIGESSVSIQTN